MKNIPVPSQTKLESFVKRMRWRAYHFINGKCEEDSDDRDNYGFNSTKSPPQVQELKHFEEYLFKLVDCIKFRRLTDPFQDKLREDVKRLRDDVGVIVKADKTKNMYSVNKDTYQKLMKDNVSKHYRAASDVQ